MPVITLTTDFGTRDGYVGAVKGVIARIAPDAHVIDIAHDIPRGDIVHAAWVVVTSTLEFPEGSIHMVVVDPGVGTTRPAVIAKMSAEPPRGEQFYVGPDNGVFAYLDIDEARTIENRRTMAAEVSATFHGRDGVAHVAAHLVRGSGLADFGASCKLTGTLPWGDREHGKGHVVHIDQYGNLISDLPADETGPFVFVHGQ